MFIVYNVVQQLSVDIAGECWGKLAKVRWGSCRCSELNTSNRMCNEMDDPIIDPDDIGVDYKKK